MTPENLRFTSAADETSMEGIAITHDAYAAIAAALPQGVDAKPVDPAAGKVFVWLGACLLYPGDILARCAGESFLAILRS